MRLARSQRDMVMGVGWSAVTLLRWEAGILGRAEGALPYRCSWRTAHRRNKRLWTGMTARPSGASGASIHLTLPSLGSPVPQGRVINLRPCHVSLQPDRTLLGGARGSWKRYLRERAYPSPNPRPRLLKPLAAAYADRTTAKPRLCTSTRSRVIGSRIFQSLMTGRQSRWPLTDR